MFSESTEWYDLLYTTMKNYGAEAAQLAQLIRQVNPGARSVLDVACGTGEHARILATTHGFDVDGLDVQPSFVEIARRKHPAGNFVVADMTGFQLPRQYDAIVCLFSSIGYLRTMARVTLALRCFCSHLAASGVVVVEPWFAPGELEAGHVSRHIGESKGVRVERVSHTAIDGRLSRLRFEYTIRDGSGVRHVTEVHELGLFTPTELVRSFQKAGLRAEYEPHGLTGRGLYVARSAA